MGKKKAKLKTAKKKSTLNLDDIPFTVDAIGNTVVVSNSGGNAFSSAGGRKIKWKLKADSGYEFKLDFWRTPYEGLEGEGNWPFKDAAPKNDNSTGWVKVFKGDPQTVGAYKYGVSVREADSKRQVGYLDPVVIVGRG
jgi:hypothetical protein